MTALTLWFLTSTVVGALVGRCIRAGMADRNQEAMP